MTIKAPSRFSVLVLVASDRIVNSFLYLFDSQEKGLKTIGLGEVQFWDGKNKESFKTAAMASVDVCLSQPEAKNNRQISRLVLIVSPFWTVSSEKIVETKAELLKEVCRAYQLKPSGFVVDDEAMVYAYQSEEGRLSSFISLFLGGDELRLSLVHLKKIKGRVKLKVDLPITGEKVKEGLAKIDFEGVLPPQIIVWGDVPSGFEESLVNYSWTEEKGSLFLHLPEIKSLTWLESADVFSKTIYRQLVQADFKQKKSSQKLPFNFSFQDMADFSSEKQEESEKEPGKEVEKVAVPKEKLSPVSRRLSLSSLLTKVSLPITRFFGLTRFLKTSLKTKNLILKLLVLALVLSAATLSLCFFLIGAEVKIFVTPQSIEKKVSVELRPGAELKLEEGIIPAKLVSTRVEESISGAATGSKLIGEKANGKVLVYNRTSEEGVFESQTVVLGPGGLEFFFKEEVRVASKTPDLVSGVDRWGEVEAEVVAADIGSQYNLAKDSLFTIKGHSSDSFLVKNKEDFSGGTSREVGAISQDDLNRAESQLKEKLKTKAEKELSKKIAEGEKTIKETMVVKTVSFESDKKAGSEGESFEASLVMEASILVFSGADIDQFASKLLKEETPEGFELQTQSIAFDFAPTEKKNDFWTGELTVEAKAYPKLDLEAVRKSIAGKKKETAIKKIRELPRVYRHSIDFQPGFLTFWPWLPYRSENINMVIGE